MFIAAGVITPSHHLLGRKERKKEERGYSAALVRIHSYRSFTYDVESRKGDLWSEY